MSRKYGDKTWQKLGFEDLMPTRKRRRIIGLTFPAANQTLGLEPSVLTVLPLGDTVEYSMKNHDFNDGDVEHYACSVYISGVEEFEQWAARHDPKKIVVGGYHPTVFPEEFRRFAFKVVRGPCDSFWDTIHQNGQIVDGIVSHEHLPRRDLYDIRNNQQIIPDKKPDDVVVSINTSQGCRLKKPCDFCCTPVMCPTLMSRPLKFVAHELTQLAAYNPDFCFIRDENFTKQRDWRARLRLIHTHLPRTKLYLFASADTLHKEDRAEFMARHGVYMVCLGLEDPTVEYAKNRQLNHSVELLHKHGIMVYLSFIVNPLNVVGREEGAAFYDLLLRRFEELTPEMVCGNFLMPFPGTALWDKFYSFVDRADYKHYDSKTPFLVRNRVVREKMRFFMFYHQWEYFTSSFYANRVRDFECGDTLHRRFVELKEEFDRLYHRCWDTRA